MLRIFIFTTLFVSQLSLASDAFIRQVLRSKVFQEHITKVPDKIKMIQVRTLENATELSYFKSSCNLNPNAIFVSLRIVIDNGKNEVGTEVTAPARNFVYTNEGPDGVKFCL